LLSSQHRPCCSLLLLLLLLWLLNMWFCQCCRWLLLLH
jgi:hypothetical protein